MEKASLDTLSPELKASMDELREAAESMKRSYSIHDPEKASDEANTIHNPIVKDSEEQRAGVTPSTAEHQASTDEQVPSPAETHTPEAAAVGDSEKEKKPLPFLIHPLHQVINRKHGRRRYSTAGVASD